ncbi:hypothetical protein AB1286_32170 [Trinickia sp. NRRL B-1857]|uniref:hypothetical protein n=1 Tax=Trinickia sp. NRRL B-1857 TaxID=3162879 RepID=UPI003D29D59B
MDTTAEIDALMASHDDAPDAAAQRLAILINEAISPEQLPRLGWLINHVLGETLEDWLTADDLQSRMLARPVDLPLAALRNAAVAAFMAGKPISALVWERRMSLVGVTAAQAAQIVHAGIISHAVKQGDVNDTAVALLGVVSAVENWNQHSPADALIASSLNNIVSTLIEQDDASIEIENVRDAIEHGAEVCRTLWLRAGSWLQQERADYLCALANARLSRYAKALEAAHRGLSIIDAHGPEDIDRAFLLLEAGRARFELGQDALGAEHIAEATRLSRTWNDASLAEWFDKRAATLPRPC